MYAQPKKSNSQAMIMLAMQIKNALELAEQQAEQDAAIMRKASDYADQVGVSEWHGSRW